MGSIVCVRGRPADRETDRIRVDETDRLDDEPTELMKDRRCAIGAIALLVAHRRDREKARGSKPGEFTMNRASPAAHMPDHLGCREIPLRLAKKQTQNTLLH